MNILEALSAPAAFSWDADKHPRDANGHFARACAPVDEEARSLLKAAQKDRTARLVAADKYEDAGRTEEAAMLRHSEHPLVVIGGGVFAAPGMADLRPGERPARSVDVIRPRRGSACNGMLLTEGGLATTVVPAADHEDYNVKPFPRTTLDAFRKIRTHSLRGEPGDLFVLSRKDEKALRDYVRTRSAAPPKPSYEHPATDPEAFPLQTVTAPEQFDSRVRRIARSARSENGSVGGHPPAAGDYDQREVERRMSLGLYWPQSELHEQCGHVARVYQQVVAYLLRHGWIMPNSIQTRGRFCFLAPSRRHMLQMQRRLPGLISQYRIAQG